MFLKNLHFSWRFLKRNPLFFAINLVGLVIGITSALFIFIYVSFETSYDRFHAGYENIYRVLGIDNALGVSNNTFTFIAIVIACLGLYGLSSFSAERKTKEIGIRKVLGAGAGSLLKVVLEEYAVLIAVANLLAWGAAWLVMSKWLSGFVYRIDVPLSSFVVATAGTGLLALATVGREILKVMRSRPVSALRYE